MDRSVGGSKDPLNDLVIPHSRPRPLATPLDRTHNTQHKQEDGRKAAQWQAPTEEGEGGGG